MVAENDIRQVTVSHAFSCAAFLCGTLRHFAPIERVSIWLLDKDTFYEVDDSSDICRQPPEVPFKVRISPVGSYRARDTFWVNIRPSKRHDTEIYALALSGPRDRRALKYNYPVQSPPRRVRKFTQNTFIQIRLGYAHAHKVEMQSLRRVSQCKCE